jgi:molybdopterin-guanine dinucleotide biosynthesis protein A
MDTAPGWLIEDSTLAPVLLDRDRVLADLGTASPVRRLTLLGVLGRAEQGLQEAERLLRERSPASEQRCLVLLAVAELLSLRDGPAAATARHAEAWRAALTRSSQASVLQRVGVRCFRAGELDRAAAHLELALTLQRGFTEPAGLAETEQALRVVRERLAFDVIVLAGGQGVRLGGQALGAKAMIPLAGWPLADHVLLAAAGATHRIQVGPRRTALAAPSFSTERPPGSGPVAAIAAGLSAVRLPVVAVLAGDLPFIAGALAGLRRAVGVDSHPVALLVDTTGRPNHLAAVWRTDALRAALAQLGDPAGQPVRRLLDRVEPAYLADFEACSADVDTPEDLRTATERLTRPSEGRLPASPLAWPGLALHAPS